MNRDGDGFRLYQKAYRPKPEEATGPDRRFRHPEEQAEIESRIAIYAEQIEKHGRFTRRLPKKGSGQSATG
jgi:hypothetical protein